ncbi:hypothetical protein C0J52_21917 [Blattella germanica]|nr:hypothetical protein C0J52_21917 [Blattella germanica]
MVNTVFTKSTERQTVRTVNTNAHPIELMSTQHCTACIVMYGVYRYIKRREKLKNTEEADTLPRNTSK